MIAGPQFYKPELRLQTKVNFKSHEVRDAAPPSCATRKPPNTRQASVQLSHLILGEILLVVLVKGNRNIVTQPSERIQSTGKFDIKGLIPNVYQCSTDVPVSRMLRGDARQLL